MKMVYLYSTMKIMHGPINIKLDFSLQISYIGNLKVGCYYLQYVLRSKPFDHA